MAKAKLIGGTIKDTKVKKKEPIPKKKPPAKVSPRSIRKYGGSKGGAKGSKRGKRGSGKRATRGKRGN